LRDPKAQMLTAVSHTGRVAQVVNTRFYFSRDRLSGPIAVVLGVLCAVAIPASARADSAQIPLTPDQRAIIDKITKPTGRGELQYAGAPTDDVGAVLQLPVQGKNITIVRKESNLQKDGSVVWYGEVQETGERAMLMLWSNALLSGYFAYDGTIYTVESLGGGVNAFSEMDRRQIPAEHPEQGGRIDNIAAPPTPKPASRPAIAEPKVAPFSDATRIALEAKDITIDVMLLYSRNVAELYIRKPEDLLALAIEETNQSFKNSGLGNIKLRLVHSEVVDYDGSEDDQFTHLYTMVDGLGPFKDVKKLRDEKRADIVGLIIDNRTGCGLSTRIGPTSDEAFFVVHHACATVTLSIAHEIGHILGVRHDRFVDQNNEPFAYGHGYVNDTKWRDIMSYKIGCGGCPRIPYWSNPRVLYKGQPTGTSASDSARVILELAERVSHFR
jgi:Metallo-peptidase family M12